MGKLTWALVLINLLVFLLVFSLPEAGQGQVFEMFSFSWATKFELWRWFTSLFLHVSASHLFFNMLGLYFFGKVLEGEVDSHWFLAVYFAAGLLGNLVFMFTSSAAVAGASGAMFGVLGAAMLLNPIKRIHLYVFPLPLGMVAILFLIFEALVVYFQPQEFANVANITHLAGLLTGSIYAFFRNMKKALESLLVLGICVALLVFLGPVFSLITGVGGLILQVLDMIIGFFLYGIAKLIGLALW
ncbi:MAG: rhomboid family intramembrane serine protease [Candidatus Aenigmatarchaeota archaeon]